MPIMPRFASPLASAALTALLCSCVQSQPTQAVAPAPQQKIQWDLTGAADSTFQYLRFQSALMQEDPQESESALETLLKGPHSPQLFLEGANFYWRRNDIGRTREVLKQGIAEFPDSLDLVLSLSTTYYAEKRYPDAILTIQEFLRDHPKEWIAYREMAVIYLADGKSPEALEAIQKIPHDKQTATSLYYGARASAGLGKTRQAENMLHRALKLDPDFLDALSELAVLYEREKNFVAAERTYGKLLEKGVSEKDVRLRLIGLNLKMNTPDKALVIFQQGPATDTQYALEAATLFLEEKFYDHAKTVLAPLQKVKGTPQRLWFYMAVLAYEGDRNSQKALDYLERIPEDSPLYERSVRFRVQLLIELNRKDKALYLIRQQKQENPDIRPYWTLEAHLLESAGRHRAARRVLEQAITKWPDDTELLYALGVIYDKLQLSQRSREIMDQIILKDPEHADALNFLGYSLVEQNKDLERAEVLIKKALSIDPENGYIIDSLAWLYLRIGQFEKAWEQIQRAVDRVTDDATLWEHYGDIARSLGNKDKAREGYSNALELAPNNSSVQEKLKAL